MTDAEKATEATDQTPEQQAPKPAKRLAKGTQARKAAPYAVIETGGKQYRVSVGDRIAVERLVGEPGSDVQIDQVLLVGGDGTTKVGTPVVEGASVSATIDDHYRGDKIIVFKFKAKKRYRRRTGHRQQLTHLVITGING
jgi:large subunit ribosomal protein L21